MEEGKKISTSKTLQYHLESHQAMLGHTKKKKEKQKTAGGGNRLSKE